LVLLDELGQDDLEHHAVNPAAISSNTRDGLGTLNHASVNELIVETLSYNLCRHVTVLCYVAFCHPPPEQAGASDLMVLREDTEVQEDGFQVIRQAIIT